MSGIVLKNEGCLESHGFYKHVGQETFGRMQKTMDGVQLLTLLDMLGDCGRCCLIYFDGCIAGGAPQLICTICNKLYSAGENNDHYNGIELLNVN